MRSDAFVEGNYRYWLVRDWSGMEGGPVVPRAPFVLWVMLNPSTADARVDDPTVRKCIGFTTRLGFKALAIVNLFALRSADPRALATERSKGEDIIGPSADAFIEAFAASASRSIFAWGAYSGVDMNKRVTQVGALIKAASPFAPECFGYSKATRQPRHPLMLAYQTPVEDWRAA